MSFSNLHLHTSNGSFLDSMIKIPELMSRLKELNHTACACTDHGSLSALLNFHKEAKKNGIKPILGCEFYEAQGSRFEGGETYHLILLAKNYEGYKNLVALSTEANLTAKYRHAGRIDGGLLEKYHSNLICMSACLSGRLARSILSGGDVENVVRYYRDIFGDDYYLEIMDNGISDQYTVNKAVIDAGVKFDIPVIMTNDTHYLYESDAKSHDILKRIHYNKKEFSGFDGHGYHLRDVNEFDVMYEQYLDTDCVVSKIEEYDILPGHGTYFMPQVQNAEKELIEKCNKSIESYFNSSVLEYRRVEYRERLNHELNIINKLGYANYFLIVSDFVQWAKDNGILVGVGRGSAGGSLVSYLLNIIGIDPLNEECPLYFERFLNPDRVSMPDIDVDVNDRDRVIEYLRAKYGENRVVNIGTISTLGTKDSISNVGRVLGCSRATIKPILDAIPIIPGDYTNESLYETDDNYKQIIDDNKLFEEIYKHAIRIEGCFKNFSQHASGLIISPKDFTDLPLNCASDHTFTQYDMYNVESLGYVKFDLLGLKTLDIIGKTLKKINNTINLTQIDYLSPDPKVMDFIRSGNTNCVFQFESDGYKALIKRVKPERFTELVDLSTLYRPGPMESGLTEQYINRKFGIEPIEHIHESTKNVLKRYGLPLFQEELMLMCTVVAGFTMAQADTVRKAIGKKDKELLDNQKKLFVDGCIKTSGLTEYKAIELWEMIEKFGRYGFNLSHGFAYTVMSYWTAYLSYYYPAAFLSANIDLAKDFEATVKIIAEAKARGVRVIPPSVNVSNIETIANDNCIYMSFNIIKGLSSKISGYIIEERENNGEFASFDDFVRRIGGKRCNKLAQRALIEAGAFDCFGVSRDILLAAIGEVSDSIADSKLNEVRREYERIGFYIGSNPIDILKIRIFNPCVLVGEVVSVKQWTAKNNKKMCFLAITDYKKNIDITVFSEQYEKSRDVLQVGNIIAINVSYNERGYIANGIDCFVDKDGFSLPDGYYPVTNFADELQNTYTFFRFCAYNNMKGKTELYCVGGNGSEYSIESIIGYRREK